jgi:hypothetical protein
MVMRLGTERPYPATGLNSRLWQEQPKEYVWFNDMTTTQNGVYLDALLFGSCSHSGDELPHAVYYEDRYYLEDGHTRVARAILDGELGMWCRIYEVPAPHLG